MSKKTVLALVGSLRAGSTNQQLAEAIQLNAPEQVEVVIHESLGNIPFYNEDIDVDGQVPAAAAALRAAANNADTILLVTPEHNGTVPASLKNAIDWLSRPFGAGALAGKPTAVVGTAFGQFGGVWAQDEARKAVGIAGARVLENVKLASPAPWSASPRSTRRTTPRSSSRSRACSTRWPRSATPKQRNPAKRAAPARPPSARLPGASGASGDPPTGIGPSAGTGHVETIVSPRTTWVVS